MADKISETAQNAGSRVNNTASESSEKWNAMTEEQKKQTFDNLPDDQKKGKSYMEWIKEGYHNQYENWMLWIEDKYLQWFTKDNKASYTTRTELDKTKVTGIDQVDKAQDGLNNAVADQVGQGGVLQPLGDMTSKEGLNRAERSGKDDSGSYGGAAGSVTDPVVNGAKSAGESASSGAKSAGSYVSGMFGGGKQEEK